MTAVDSLLSNPHVSLTFNTHSYIVMCFSQGKLVAWPMSSKIVKQT